MSDARRELAVLGSPIEHSKSPLLHSTAYRELGLDWSYGRYEVDAAALAPFIERLDAAWRGLSLTMPLKEAVIPLLDEVDPVAVRTGAVNTVLFDGRRLGWNTDVGGIVRSFEQHGVPDVEHAVLLGTGATARSVLTALHEHGVQRVTVSGRSAERAEATARFAAELGIAAEVHSAGLHWTSWPDDAGLVVSSLPGVADFDAPPVPNDVALFDVAYSGSALTDTWRQERPTSVIVTGIDMLVHQAVLQVRIFVGGSAELPLPAEARVLKAMDEAVGRS